MVTKTRENEEWASYLQRQHFGFFSRAAPRPPTVSPEAAKDMDREATAMYIAIELAGSTIYSRLLSFTIINLWIFSLTELLFLHSFWSS